MVTIVSGNMSLSDYCAGENTELKFRFLLKKTMWKKRKGWTAIESNDWLYYSLVFVHHKTLYARQIPYMYFLPFCFYPIVQFSKESLQSTLGHSLCSSSWVDWGLGSWETGGEGERNPNPIPPLPQSLKSPSPSPHKSRYRLQATLGILQSYFTLRMGSHQQLYGTQKLLPMCSHESKTRNPKRVSHKICNSMVWKYYL